MDANVAKLKNWIDASDNIVFFGGAGVSVSYTHLDVYKRQSIFSHIAGISN